MSSAKSGFTPLTTEKCVRGEGLDTIEIEPWQVKEVPGLTIVGTTIAKTGTTTLEVFYHHKDILWTSQQGLTHMFSIAPCDTLEGGEAGQLRTVKNSDLEFHINVFQDEFVPYIRQLISFRSVAGLSDKADVALKALAGEEGRNQIPHQFRGHMCSSRPQTTQATAGVLGGGAMTGGYIISKDEHSESSWVQEMPTAPVDTLPYKEISDMTFKESSF